MARPFRDAYGWTKDLFNARSENEDLKAENELLRQQVIQNESALQQNVVLKRLLEYQDSPSFPADYDGVSAEVIARPASAFEQEIVVSAGSSRGVKVNAAVVTADGFVGTVTKVTDGAARVRLLTDEQSAVSSVDLRTRASGVVVHGESGNSLALDRVSKREVVHVGDEIVTAGWRAGALASLYPEGDPDRPRLLRRRAQHRSLAAGADRVRRRLLRPRLGRRARASAPVPGAPVSFGESAIVAAIVFVAALLQVTLFASLDVAGGVADVLLLSLLSIALLRGAVVGTVAGFFGGLLVDVLTLDTLGVSALLYALAGYWAGRYGETTGRDRGYAPLLTVLVATIAIAYVGYGLHFLLGEEVSARRALFETLLPTLVLNLARRKAGLRPLPLGARPRVRVRPRHRGEAPWLAPIPSAARRRAASCRRTRAPPSRTASRRSWRCASACSPGWR